MEPLSNLQDLFDHPLRCICDQDTSPSVVHPTEVLCTECGCRQHEACMFTNSSQSSELVRASYKCEKCDPRRHVDTIEALENRNQEAIWKTRARLHDSTTRIVGILSQPAVLRKWMERIVPDEPTGDRTEAEEVLEHEERVKRCVAEWGGISLYHALNGLAPRRLMAWERDLVAVADDPDGVVSRTVREAQWVLQQPDSAVLDHPTKTNIRNAFVQHFYTNGHHEPEAVQPEES